jgi:hypothetical protein
MGRTAAMLEVLCARSVRVAYVDDGSCLMLMHARGADSGRVGRRSASEPGVARRTERGMPGIATTIAGGAGRWRWTRRRRAPRRHRRIGRHRCRECRGMSRKTR